MNLGLNIDHIATIRQARQIAQPNPLEAVFIATNCGVDQITIHLREDRRHINDEDVRAIIANSPLPVNVECASEPAIIDFLCALKPSKVTLVPEKREEITTEGGLKITPNLKDIIQEFHKNDIQVVTFIDPSLESIELSKAYNADGIELHTGEYANIYDMLHSSLRTHKNRIAKFDLPRNELEGLLKNAFKNLEESARIADSMDLIVCAGHGLNYQNVIQILKIPQIIELNIGHSIIARAVIVGLESAIKEMLKIIKR